MTGIEAITYHNGWAMAFAGAMIVFSGLVALCLAISLFPRLVGFLEKKPHTTAPPKAPPAEARPAETPPATPSLPTDIDGALILYQPLIDTLDQPFELSQLYARATQEELPHPHLTLSYLRQAGILVPQGEGLFTWHPRSS